MELCLQRAQRGLHLHRSHGLESANSPQQSSSAANNPSPNRVFSGSAAAQQPVSQPCILRVSSSLSLLFSSRTWHLHFNELSTSYFIYKTDCRSGAKLGMAAGMGRAPLASSLSCQEEVSPRNSGLAGTGCTCPCQAQMLFTPHRRQMPESSECAADKR